VLHGDSHSESVLTDVGAEPLRNARNLNVESNFEYGSRVGFWQIMRLLREYGADATVYAVGMALERNPRLRRRSPAVDLRWPVTGSDGSTISLYPRKWNARTCCATSRSSRA